MIDNLQPGHLIGPATIVGDITGGNVINIRSLGVTRFSVWLTQDLIDWTKKVRVNINGQAAQGYRAKST